MGIRVSEIVVRHPFDRFESDSLGEGGRPVFADDVVLGAYGVDPGGVSEPGMDTDTALADTPTLYFRRLRIESSGHDEWSVRGYRYLQDGDALVWERNGRVAGTVIRLKRRTG